MNFESFLNPPKPKEEMLPGEVESPRPLENKESDWMSREKVLLGEMFRAVKAGEDFAELRNDWMDGWEDYVAEYEKTHQGSRVAAVLYDLRRSLIPLAQGRMEVVREQLRGSDENPEESILYTIDHEPTLAQYREVLKAFVEKLIRATGE